MFGYVTKKEAIEKGFTHHGRYYRIPVYISLDNDFEVTAKWIPFDYLIEFVCYIEIVFCYLFNPEQEGFKFEVGKELKED